MSSKALYCLALTIPCKHSIGEIPLNIWNNWFVPHLFPHCFASMSIYITIPIPNWSFRNQCNSPSSCVMDGCQTLMAEYMKYSNYEIIPIYIGKLFMNKIQIGYSPADILRVGIKCSFCSWSLLKLTSHLVHCLLIGLAYKWPIRALL